MSSRRMSAALAAALAVCAFAAVPFAAADIATPRPQWTAVQMKSEAVAITLGEKSVKVEATFQMLNTGKQEAVRFGYPLGLFEKELTGFAVLVNNEPVKNVRTEAKPGAADAPSKGGGFGGGRGGAAAAETYRFDGPYKQWKVFDVPMAAGETKSIKITYSVEPARITDAAKNPLLHYCYTLQTGATWKGKIEQAVITVKLDGVEPANLVRVVPAGSEKSQDGKTLTWTMKDFKPAADIEITYRPAAR